MRVGSTAVQNAVRFVELPTKWFEATYSIQLSYGCVGPNYIGICSAGHPSADRLFIFFTINTEIVSARALDLIKRDIGLAQQVFSGVGVVWIKNDDANTERDL
jgi:hypothetical protein